MDASANIVTIVAGPLEQGRFYAYTRHTLSLTYSLTCVRLVLTFGCVFVSVIVVVVVVVAVVVVIADQETASLIGIT